MKLLILTLVPGRRAAVRRAAQRTRQRGTRGRAGRTTSVRGFRAGLGRTVRRDRRLLIRRRRRAGRRRGHPGAQRSGGRRPACRGEAGDPGRAGVADTHVGADSRVSLGGHSDTALVALGAEPGHLSRGEGPGDDVRPHRRQVARRWACRDAVAGMIRAAAPTAHRRRCCTRSADMCCHGRRLAGCSHGDRLLVPGRHRARAITSPRALKAA